MLFLKVGTLVLVTAILFIVVRYTEACNEAVCASIVSKCMLQHSCDCNSLNYTCYKECFFCLSYLYDECCSCIDLCPKLYNTNNPLGKKSHVEDLDEPIPSLFRALTVEPDASERWVSYTFPMDFNSLLISPMHNKMNYYSLNCTVAYMSHCISWNKCKASCLSMGATSYRWFHDGCCECIGNTCINYGINESRCTHCPTKNDINHLIEEFDDYGQDED